MLITTSIKDANVKLANVNKPIFYIIIILQFNRW